MSLVHSKTYHCWHYDFTDVFLGINWQQFSMKLNYFLRCCIACIENRTETIQRDERYQSSSPKILQTFFNFTSLEAKEMDFMMYVMCFLKKTLFCLFGVWISQVINGPGKNAKGHHLYTLFHMYIHLGNVQPHYS